MKLIDVTDVTDELRAALLAHAAAQAPRECCGLVVNDGMRLHYVPARNLYAGTAGEDRFELDPDAWPAAEALGEVVAVAHSHPHASANPSMADRVGCERSKLPWLILGWPSGMIKLLAPSGWSAPYQGRTFHHGVLDCYTMIQDWYWRELQVELPDFDRRDEWWLQREGGPPAQDLYMEHFAEAGFVLVQGEPRRHDVPLIQVMSERANHSAVFVRDGVILHHLAGRLSCEDVWGGYWQRHMLGLLRHESMVAA